ncbi:class I SAM-dependent methyltransferase [uncultured Methanoregula sp.]|uniref:class I SAM-dependent methyltransferase n=1 Tax=uncultured Methanoregula sp. TaxID=1005933 RepID=UPI002AAC145C|nr:class I SAM-dependent methyltransferase [uncultured Methanoregula sp.]
MTGSRDPYPVSDTAALVMLWASGYYANKPLTGTYLGRLDLSAGQMLLDRYHEICPWYPEVIINRKHFIRSNVEDLIRNSNKETVIVNLGAGFSPLALELVPFLSDRVRFIEMDLRNMDRKTRLYSDLIPDQCRFISCIEADIGDTACLDETLAGFTGTEKTRLIVVMEGLTYYIGRPVMERVLACLSGLTRDQHIIFEHLKPCRLVSEERKFIPYRIFSHVRDYTAMDRMTTYSDDEIRRIIGPAFTCSYSDMDKMEKRRTGTNTYFPTPESGWLSCAIASRGTGK